MSTITAEEFERQYAARSGVTVEQLRALGRIVAPCDCGDTCCEGWQSTTLERLRDDPRYASRDVGVLITGATTHVTITSD